MASGETLVRKPNASLLCESSPEFQVPKPIKPKKRQCAALSEPKSAAVIAKPRGDADENTRLRQQVLDYLRLQNRPYSAQNIFDNLHGTIPRVQLQTILDEASAEENEGNGTGELLCKTYGKFKIYLIHQASLSASPEVPTEAIQALETSVQALMQQVRELEQRLRAQTDKWSHLTLEELTVLRDKERQRVHDATQRRNELQRQFSSENDGTPRKERMFSEEEVHALQVTLQEEQRRWKLRREKCYDLLDAVAQLLDTTVTDAIEQLDIEVGDGEADTQ